MRQICDNHTTYTVGCDACKAARRAYKAQYSGGHGTYSNYTAGCRCDVCRKANTDYKASRRRKADYPRPEIPHQQDWVEQSACHGLNADIFFDERPNNDNYWRAREICDTCPVRVDCLEHALNAREPLGVWGGLDPDERRRLIRKRRAIRATTKGPA